MTAQNSKRLPQRGQRGYALLLVIFLVATMMVLAVAGSLKIATQGRREKEAELAWRGNQYSRAIRLFYKKNGRFPKTMDELTAYHTDQPMFIRKAYKDPMNKTDGSWRLIYLLPNGQLSGSFMHQQLLGAVPVAGPLGGSPAGAPGSSIGQPTTGTGTQQAPSTGQMGTSGQSDQNTSDSTVFGGSIVGVASKSKDESLRVYKLGQTYDHWEFIDPDLLNPTPGAFPPGAPSPGAPTAAQPPANPGGPPQNPSQSQTPLIDH